MKRLLVVSPLEVLGSRNSRTYHLVRHLSSHFQETISISRTNITRKSFWYKLTALFRIRTKVLTEGKIRWIAMTHWGSTRDGLGFHVLGIKNPYTVKPRDPRLILQRILNLLGIVLELGILPSLVLTYMIRVRKHADVFIGEGPWEVAFALLLRALGKVRFVVYDDIDYAPGFLPRGFRKHMISTLERFAVRHADLVISVGNRLAHLRRKQGARIVHVIPNGVDREMFSMAWRRRSEKGQRRPTLIYIGYLGSWAGVDIILDAVALASKRISGLRMILLGHGAPEDLLNLRERINNLGIEDAVDLRGEVAYIELPGHLSEADVGMAIFRPIDLTCYAFPLKVVEYMASGLPVLTTEGTEAADLVTRSDVGMVVPFDVKAVADAIYNMLQDKEKYRQYSENAIAFSKAYDWEILIRECYSLIKQGYKICR